MFAYISLLVVGVLTFLTSSLRGDPPVLPDAEIVAGIRALKGVRILLFDPRSALDEEAIRRGHPLEQAYTSLRLARRLQQLGFSGRIQFVVMEAQRILSAEEELFITMRRLKGEPVAVTFDDARIDREIKGRWDLLDQILPGTVTRTEGHFRIKHTPYLGPVEILPFSQAAPFTRSEEMPLGIAGGLEWETVLHPAQSLNTGLFLHLHPPFHRSTKSSPAASWSGIGVLAASGRQYLFEAVKLGLPGGDRADRMAIPFLEDDRFEIIPVVIPLLTEEDVIALGRYLRAFQTIRAPRSKPPVYVVTSLINTDTEGFLRELAETAGLSVLRPAQNASGLLESIPERGAIVFLPPLPIPQLEWLIQSASQPLLVRSFTGRDLAQFLGKPFLDLNEPFSEPWEGCGPEDRSELTETVVNAQRFLAGGKARNDDATTLLAGLRLLPGGIPTDAMLGFLLGVQEPGSKLFRRYREMETARANREDMLTRSLILTRARFIDDDVAHRPVFDCGQAVKAASRLLPP